MLSQMRCSHSCSRNKISSQLVAMAAHAYRVQRQCSSICGLRYNESVLFRCRCFSSSSGIARCPTARPLRVASTRVSVIFESFVMSSLRASLSLSNTNTSARPVSLSGLLGSAYFAANWGTRVPATVTFPAAPGLMPDTFRITFVSERRCTC